MNVWCHLPTIINRRIALCIAGLLTLSVALITTLFLSMPTHAETGINQTISFQGRLLNSSGGTVPDGFYNMKFSIYQDGSGQSAGNPDGSLSWSEGYINNNAASGIRVKNGYFSVELGSRTPFGSNIDWNQANLWLSMNIAGSADACTTFGTAPCVADGEMLPMKRLTSTPYAMNAGKVGGKTADNLVQLAQGVQTDASTNTSSIYINKTGTGNLIQLQNTATDVFTVASSGDITLGNNADHNIGVATSTGSNPGRELTINAGDGGASGAQGGNLVLQGGDAGGTNQNGGNVAIDAGTATGSGAGGTISIGTGSASGITIGHSGTTTTVDGNLATGNVATDGSVTANNTNGTNVAFDAQLNGTSNAKILANGTISGTALQAASLDTITASSLTIGASNATDVTIGNAVNNITTTILGTTIIKPTSGHDSTVAFQLQRAGGSAMLTADSTNQTITLGDSASANKIVISTATGQLTKYGNARDTRTIRLAAEYQNAVLDNGTGSNNSGTMLSSLDLTNRMNFYRWTATQATPQTYDIVTQVPIPQDFSAWSASTPISISTRTSNTSNGGASIELRDSTGTVRCNFTTLSMGSINTWTTQTPNCLSAGTYSPGDYMTLRIRMSAANNANVDVGNIVLNYLSSK